jgi:nucleoside-diphosphate-sugar epimerase
VRKKKDVDRAVRGVDCVFHLASYGGSGKDMLQVGRVDETNITGTCNVLDSCRESGVRRLVYLSSYNVVFGGKEILNGNETDRYYPIESNPDPFGRSKCLAEQLVLKSNGRPGK